MPKSDYSQKKSYATTNNDTATVAESRSTSVRRLSRHLWHLYTFNFLLVHDFFSFGLKVLFGLVVFIVVVTHDEFNLFFHSLFGLPG